MKARISSCSLAASVAVLSLTASPAWAHPGHEHPVTPPNSPMHWFLEPQHFLGWVGIACVLIAFYKARQAWVQGTSDGTTAHEKNPH